MNKRTDYHAHILPGIDDGAKDVETSLKMLEMLKNQGVERVVATPHFYAHREKSVEHFLEKRQKAYEKLTENPLPTEVVLGAEISVEIGISDRSDIEKLAIGGTDLILLEPPYSGYSDRIPEEIYNLSSEYQLTPMIAHVHRYRKLYSKSEFEKILGIKAIFQINNEAFSTFADRIFVKTLLRKGIAAVFGSDTHNPDRRRPNFDLLMKKARTEWILDSDRIFDTHRL
jgi:protein-tyrosine phosphatase